MSSTDASNNNNAEMLEDEEFALAIQLSLSVHTQARICCTFSLLVIFFIVLGKRRRRRRRR